MGSAHGPLPLSEHRHPSGLGLQADKQVQGVLLSDLRSVHPLYLRSLRPDGGQEGSLRHRPGGSTGEDRASRGAHGLHSPLRPRPTPLPLDPGEVRRPSLQDGRRDPGGRTSDEDDNRDQAQDPEGVWTRPGLRRGAGCPASGLHPHGSGRKLQGLRVQSPPRRDARLPRQRGLGHDPDHRLRHAEGR